MRTWICGAVFGAALVAALPTVARAQNTSMNMPMQDAGRWYVAPFTGAPFGGNTNHTSSTVGLSGGWSRGWLSLEAELADSPELFEQNGFLTSRRVTTFMGNAVIGLGRHGRLMPFAVGGIGLLRPHLTEAGGLVTIRANRLGYDVGGGAVISVHTHVGVRGDLRYFHGLRQTDADVNELGLDVSAFGFWRVSGGLVVRF